MSAIALNALSLVLLVMAVVAYPRRMRLELAAAACLFFPVTAGAVLASWWPVSHPAAAVILIVPLGASLAIMLLFLIDVIWAPFCLEMTYLTFLCWILCPVTVALNLAGMALQLLRVGA
jgi:hypothetical protein